ncbi:hypothetical protein C8R43DRAFT_956352 [Mycena crocata]|nr:hypothetical protein C8R43DRAFT_956352 [Mycena crocata]
MHETSYALYLPSEIIDEIVQHAPPRELLALCRADRRMYAIAITYVYRIVDIATPTALVEFCDALCAREVLVKLVTVLTISFANTADSQSRRNILNDRQRRATCATTIAKLHNLTELEITRAPYLLPLLPPDSFPHLRHFHATFTPHISHFLRGHPLLEALHIGYPQKHSQSRVQIPPLHLTQLRAFSGPEVLARAVLPGSRVTHPIIYWDPEPWRRAPAEKCIARLALVGSPVAALHSVMSGWDAPDPRAIAAALPDLVALEFQNLGPPDRRVEFLDNLIAALPRFTRLRRLALYDEVQYPPWAESILDWEWEELDLWQTLCPSLEDCTLFSGIRWVRCPKRKMWLPAPTTDRVEEGESFLRWFEANVAVVTEESAGEGVEAEQESP